MRPDSDRIAGIDFSPDGLILLAVDSNGRIRKFNPAATNATYTSHSNNDDANSLAYNHDGSLYATGSDDDRSRIWNGTAGQQTSLVDEWDADDDPVLTVDFSYDGKWFAMGSED